MMYGTWVWKNLDESRKGQMINIALYQDWGRMFPVTRMSVPAVSWDKLYELEYKGRWYRRIYAGGFGTYLEGQESYVPRKLHDTAY